MELFSGAGGIPIAIFSDFSFYAEAIYAASEPLIIDAEDLNDGEREALENIALMAVCSALGVTPDELTDEQRDICANFKNPAMPSIVSQTDSMIKIASVVPDFPGTEVFWEQLGFPEDVRRRISSELKSAQGSQLVTQALLGAANNA